MPNRKRLAEYSALATFMALCAHPGTLAAAATNRDAPVAAAAPAFGCWFWSATEFEPEGYRPFLDLVSKHAAFDRLTTSLRVAGHEVTEAATHDQIRRAAEYAERCGLKLVMDLDVRLARAAFQRAHPDELQEMLRLREVELATTGEIHLTITADVLRAFPPIM